MKRLIVLAAIPLLVVSNCWCQCTSAPEFTQEEIVTCDEDVWLTTHPNLTSWNDNEAVSDSFLVSTSGVVSAASVVLDSSALMLDGQLSYLNLGHGFDDLEFPVSVVIRFSMEPGFTYGTLFATDEGLGYSGLAFYCGLEGVESFIGDGFGGGPGQRRSKLASFDFEIGEWYTFVGVIRGASDHSLFIDGLDLGGNYSGYGNGEVVDLGRPATIGYHVPDSGPAAGQERSAPVNVDFVGIYDYDVSPMVEEYGNSCFQDSGNMDSLGGQSDALAWYDFEAENPFKDSSSNQPDIVAEGNVQSEVVLCVCENSVEITVIIQETGCADAEACNFDSDVLCDDGSCDYSCCPGPGCCDQGLTWNWELSLCQDLNPADINFDGCVQLNDLLDLLSAYGDCGANEAPWQCGDALEYQGYDYETVQIGEQCWFAENLTAYSFANGDPIPNGDEIYQSWPTLTTPGLGFPEFDISFKPLYNFFVVDDPRGVCPQGWVVPEISQFPDLTNWPDVSLPGYLNADPFNNLLLGQNEVEFFWSRTQTSDGRGFAADVSSDFATEFGINHHDVNFGFSIRCIKDAE